MTLTLPPRETLTVEFKSDRKRLPDNDLVEAVVGLANTEGGTLWLGVEDDGTPTGLHVEHQLLDGLVGLIAGRTSPSLGVSVMALELDDAAMDGALGFTARQPDGRRVPTLTGLLLIGRETALRDLVPTHEFAFQVLAQQAVRFNEFRRFPLLKALDWLETNFRPYNPEDELQVGLFRVPVPMLDLSAFREAVANALIHRDYHRLADAMKRIGVVERSGRGVDKIFRGLLKYGRPAPDYSRTDAQGVTLRLPTEAADLDFRRLVVEEERRRTTELPIDA